MTIIIFKEINGFYFFLLTLSLEKETKELSSANKIMKNEISAIKEEFLTHKEAMHTMKMKLKKKNAEIKENQFNFQQLEDSYHKQVATF